MKHRNLVWVYGLFFLFFLQLLSDFIESIYVFGLLSTGVTAEIGSVVLLFSPVVLLVLRKDIPRAMFVLLLAGMLAGRLISVILGPSAKMVVCGIGVGCGLIVLPGLIWDISRSRVVNTDKTVASHTHTLGSGLLLAVAFSITLRMLGAGFDISTHGWTQIFGWVGAVFCGVVILGAPLPDVKLTTVPQETPSADEKPAIGRIAGLCVGLSGIILCVYFVLMSPNVIARWTGVPYPIIISVLLPALGVLARLMICQPGKIRTISRKTLLLWNVIFLLSLVLTLTAHQIDFPLDASAYPLMEPVVTVLYHIPLFMMLLLSPVVFLDFIYFLWELFELRPTSRQLGEGFTLAALYMLLLILAQVFTTVYDYIPVVGPWFRDRFWFVFLCVGLGFTLPLLLLRKRQLNLDIEIVSPAFSRMVRGGILLFIIVVLAAAWLMVPRPPLPGTEGSLRILTYNIQQGYSEGGVKNFAGQLKLLREVDADIIGLQESDTNRVAGGNADIVGYFARALNMHAYYGPKTVQGTFGIALLSKYPIQSAETFYMYSLGEQTATIHAQIHVAGVDYNVYVTHLGNGGPIVQQEAILDHVHERDNVILVGDFNFKPESDQYYLTTSSLDDAWIIQDSPDATGYELDPQQRIDHIFVTLGTQVARSRYIVSPASDHPAMWAELTW
jgi:endonuclease/exonuclease/phosphatase family metal-dependent hydrolase